MPPKSVAIHGHFYQPDRFIPEIHAIPQDIGAQVRSNHRRSNWNEVIYDECYQPLAEHGAFSQISFDCYRTLFDWLKKYSPFTYQQILHEAAVAKARDGVTNVLGAPYDHVILPQLSRLDAETEIAWGVADYTQRFGEPPQGFWLPETAINGQILELLTKYQIRYIILAPWQAQAEIDTSKVYKILVGQSHIKCVFYNKPFSEGLSFDAVGAGDVGRFVETYICRKDGPFFLGTSDGERYGHHLEHGDQFLAHLIDTLRTQDVQVTPVGKFIAENAPYMPVQVRDNTSWSCPHGLLRWRGDCPCTINDQTFTHISGTWKAIMFHALHTLGRELDILFMGEVLSYVHDPARLLLDYSAVLLGQVPRDAYIQVHATQKLSQTEIDHIATYLEIMRYKLASFTSCGFFFADIDRPEPKICIANAKQALRLLHFVGKQALAKTLEKQLITELTKITSLKTGKNGRDVYFEYELC